MKGKAAIYCRLSKEDVDKENHNQESQSIINQTMMLLDYVEQNNFELYDIYKDDDYSGLYDDRPGFEKLIEDAKKHRFDVIVAKSQSRFTRNIEHLEKYLHHDFPLWGIRFISLVDNVDTEIKGNKKARQINGLINEWYCEDLSESIKASFRIKQKQGQFLGASAPYGYVKDENDNHKLVPDPYSAGIVKRIFQMYLGGIGKARIGRILTGEGVLIPTNYKRDVLNVNYHNANQKYDTESKWSFQTINTILHNEVYIGNMVQNKSCKKSYKDKGKENVPKKEWIRVENTHEPIIDFKVFQKVQKLLNERTYSIDISCLNKSLFANRLFCGDCGRPMTPCYSKRNKAGERHRKYICSDYKKFGNKYCSSHSILEETLKNIILNDLRIQSKILLTDEARVSLHDFRCISSIKNRSDKIKQLNDAQQKTQNYKQRAFENFADGILSKPEYMSLKEKYDKREKQLLQDIKEYNELHMEQSTIRDFEYWLENFTDDFSIDEITREMVLELIDSIYIYDNKTITINYKFQFNAKSNPSSKKMKRTMCGIS